MDKCQQHSDCYLKYFCIDLCCSSQMKLCCAECQIDGPHRKHDFKNINLFKNLIGNISAQCAEYLIKQAEQEKIIEQVKEEFEYMRIYISEQLQKMQNYCIQFINSSKNSQKNQQQNLNQQVDNQNSELQQQIIKLNKLRQDSIKQENDFINNYDQNFLYNLYNQREQLFTNLIEKQSFPLKQIVSIKVQIINNMQGVLQQFKEKLSLNEQSLDIVQQSFDLSQFQAKLVKEATLTIQNDQQQILETNIQVRILKDYNQYNVLVITSDNIMRIYDKNTLQIVKEFKGHNWLINDVIILNQSIKLESQTYLNNQQYFSEFDQLISCSSDTTIKIWNVNDQVVLQNIKSHYLEVTSLVLFDENNLLSAGKDSIVFFYEISYSQINDLQNHFKINEKYSQDNQDKTLEKLEFIPRVEKIISKITQVYELKYLEFPIKQIEKINEIFFVVGYMNGVLSLVNFEQRQFLYSFDDKHELGLYCLAKIDESTFCSSGGDSKVKIWNLTQSHCICQYQLAQQDQQKLFRDSPQNLSSALEKCLNAQTIYLCITENIGSFLNSSCKFGPECIKNLGTYFSNFRNLFKLNIQIRDNSISDEGLSQFGQALAKLANIQNLVLKFTQQKQTIFNVTRSKQF
ncbi:hypothetical protein ABPG73_006469 [Tetrahymena malaccensis]